MVIENIDIIKMLHVLETEINTGASLDYQYCFFIFTTILF